MDMGDLYIRKKQAAELLGIALRTLTNWERQKVVPFRKIGRLVLFKKSEIDRALNSFRVKGKQPPVKVSK